jgi:pilus assembly protein CpaE
MKQSILTFTSTGGQYEADIQAQLSHLCQDLRLPAQQVISARLPQVTQHLANNVSPKVLIVDFSSIESAIDTAADTKITEALNQLAEVCEPGTKVIIIGREIPLAQYRQLLSLGVEDYLPLPVNYDALLHCVKQSLGFASNPRQQHCKNIVISGLQGGVGSTTLTTALALKLAQEGSHTLIADIDTELGDLSLFWPELSNNSQSQAIQLQQLQELNSIDRASQTLAERLNYLAINPSSPNNLHEEVSALQSKLAGHASTILWDVPRHHILAKELWLQADICIWVLESSVSVLRHWHTIKNHLENKPSDEVEKNQRHIFVLNQTRKERSQQISIKKLEQALQQSLIVLPYAGQQALDAANLGQAELLLQGSLGKGIDDVCAHILARSKKVNKHHSPLKSLLRQLRKEKPAKAKV